MNRRRKVPLYDLHASPAACTLHTRVAVCRKVPLFPDLDPDELRRSSQPAC